MGVDLKSESGDEFQFNNSGWRRIIALAEGNGFDDSNCSEPEEGVCVVPAASAIALADAIEKSLTGGDDAEIARRVSHRLTELLVEPSSSPMFPDDPIQFNERGVKYWREFVRFARRGGFTAHF
jgi:hypothetical protein